MYIRIILKDNRRNWSRNRASMDNHAVAQKLMDYAQYLEAREANLYRVRAYRRAAETVLSLERPLAEVVADKGRAGLEELQGIGSHLSFTLEEMVRTGEFRTLNPDGGRIDPEQVLLSLPGIGPRLARQIYQQLGISTLEEVERAAYDGRLGRLGLGPKRLRGIRDALAGRFRRYRLPAPVPGEPAVSEFLVVDQEYRTRAELMVLPTIAPRRFNPNQEPWLPLFQTRRGGWRYRALFSNTALAHRLGQTRNWVIVYFDNGISSGQRTIVSEANGELAGRRVVRGREHECAEYYRALNSTTEPDTRQDPLFSA
jgi:DNA polymerase (family 10)